MLMFKNKPLACQPVDSLAELLKLVDEPPAWRTLCKELTPHSEYRVRNMDLNKRHPFSMEAPEPFCHYDPVDDEPQWRHHKDLPITLICHDMANGYHDDSYIEGTTNYGAYTFYNWAVIDIFCYFSHHFVTIPPVSWINVAHAHGVKVIGTVITEWAEGMAFWDSILESEAKCHDFASALVAVAKTLKFEGWLLNIENKVNHPTMLIKFVSHLHEMLHQEVADAVLVWYDSVTVKGHLNWQNGLNEKNKAFFEVSDYFFTNYSWTKEQVEESAREAGARGRDLLVGIDVWGRNFYGGGQFNIMEAVRVAYEAQCSLAVFAPAWTHEALSEDIDDPNYVSMSDGLDKFQKFDLRERALWNTMWPFLCTKMPCSLPFQTSFCKGQGRKRWLYGEVMSPGGWVNLRHQQYQVGAPGPHGYLLSRADIIRRLMRRRISTYQSFLQIRNDLHGSRNSKDMSLLELLEDFLDTLSVDSSKDKRRSIAVKESSQNSIHDSHMKTSSTEAIDKEKPKVCFSSDERASSSKDDSVAHDPSTTNTKRSKFKSAVASMRSKLKFFKSKKSSDTNRCSSETKKEKESDCTIADVPKEESDTSIDEVAQGEGINPLEPSVSELPSAQQMSVHICLRHEEEKTRWALSHVTEEKECLQVYLEDAFTGGSCLCINPSDDISSVHRHTRLLFCDFLCEHTLVFCVVTKTLADCEFQYLQMMLSFMVGGERKRAVLVGWPANSGLEPKVDTEDIKYYYPLDPRGESFEDLRKYLLIHEPGFYVSVDNQFGWKVCYYTMNTPGWQLVSVNCRTRMGHGPILLGHFGICKRDQS